MSLDRTGSGYRLGGAAAYAALTAKRLGCRTGIVTSTGPDFPFWKELEGIDVRNVPAAHTTAFENNYEDGVRRQRVIQTAGPIREEHLEELPLAEDTCVLYCPILHEVEARLVPLAPKGLCGVAPQGLFRSFDTGAVSITEWPEAERALSRADFVSMSEEDAPVAEELAERFRRLAFVITRGEKGCRVYSQGNVYDFASVPTEVVDPTGAGDVFAAAFLIALRARKDLLQAARLAARTASMSIAAEGVGALL